MRENKIYRVSIIIQEYDGDGFWDVSSTIQMADSKEKLIETFDSLVSIGKKYIDDRLK